MISKKFATLFATIILFINRFQRHLPNDEAVRFFLHAVTIYAFKKRIYNSAKQMWIRFFRKWTDFKWRNCSCTVGLNSNQWHSRKSSQFKIVTWTSLIIKLGFHSNTYPQTLSRHCINTEILNLGSKWKKNG